MTATCCQLQCSSTENAIAVPSLQGQTTISSNTKAVIAAVTVSICCVVVFVGVLGYWKCKKRDSKKSGNSVNPREPFEQVSALI